MIKFCRCEECKKVRERHSKEGTYRIWNNLSNKLTPREWEVLEAWKKEG